MRTAKYQTSLGILVICLTIIADELLVLAR